MLKKRKKELERLIWAHQCWRAAYSLCELGMSLPENESDTNFGIMSGIIVSYARPFTRNDGLGELEELFTKFEKKGHEVDHQNLITLRHKVFGHRDEQWAKEEIGTKSNAFVVITPDGHLRTQGLGDSSEPCQEILDLLAIQLDRCSARVREILEEGLAKNGAFEAGTYILIDERPYIKKLR